MKYVFFDIECACVYKSVAKICAFGYVVTDENFEVLEREDILINPKGKFHLTDRKGNEGITLPYEYEDFKNYPAFRARYAQIRALLEGKDTLVLGHATFNDVKYLNLETKRYKLPSFRFAFHDTQFFYMNVTGDYGKQLGLGAIAEKLGIEFTPHRAVNDAYATMLVCKALCERENTDIAGFCARYGIRAGRIGGYRIQLVDSVGRAIYLRDKEEERLVRAKAHDKFYRYVNKFTFRHKGGGVLDGKKFCFSRELEEETDVSLKLAAAIFAESGKYTNRPADCDVYIARERGGMRYERAMRGGATFVTPEEFEKEPALTEKSAKALNG